MKDNFSFSKVFISGETHLAFWSYIKKILTVADSFFILKSLTIYQFGIYQILLAGYAVFSDIFHDLFQSVVGNDIARLIGEKKEGLAKKLFKQYVIFRLFTALIPFIFFFFFAEVLPIHYGEEAKKWIHILSLLFLVDAINLIFSMILNNRLYFRVMAVRPSLQKIVQFIFLSYFYFFSTLTIDKILYIHVLTPLIVVILLSPYFIKALGVWRNIQSSSENIFWKIITTYGFWEIPQLAFKDLIGKVRPFVIKFLISTEAVGLFGIANTALSLLKDVLPIRTINTLVPRKIAEPKYLEYLYIYATKYYTLLAIILATVGAILYPIIVTLIFPAYEKSIPIFFILLPTLIIFAFTKMISVLLLAKRRQKFLFFQSANENILNIALMVILAPIFALSGLALSTTLSEFTIDISRYVFLVKRGFIKRYPFSRLLSYDENDQVILQKIYHSVLAMFRKKINHVDIV